MAPIQFGVLMIEYQTIDVVGPLDILSSCSKGLIASVERFSTDPNLVGLTNKAIDIEFHHINETMGEHLLNYSRISINPLTERQTPFH